ncbi:aminoglycoside phosphotransferase [Stutzerimonas kirkiae]|uniref:Aminoglycoside phosphotransferase n=1 Tax=Stutzerimonas kirkiae TaxID=2211392 RepID=A0A4Q9R3J3_9GAMM|nr:phosphotransferase [Stutzerimonas kirkiae]TBU93301.1 aminoglycoside phosphotransferase [Stutzerimonas kirkiae]TBV01435.1 aminoglycoside phosphotransferase [Stutzerimonas kirkiae]
MSRSARVTEEPLPQEWDSNGQAALASFGLPADCSLRLLSLSENATYLVTEPGSGQHHILRLHRPGYRSRAEIESELAWIGAIRTQGVAHTPAVIRTLDDEPLAEFRDARGCRQHAVLFAHIDGQAPTEGNLAEAFQQVGRISAELHRHSRGWPLPAGFSRPCWDVEAAMGVNGHWGYWRNNLYVGKGDARLLERVDLQLRRQLAAYGRPAHGYGLIHGDMRQTNLIVEAGQVHIIDFDDCGFSWHLYELACSLSFIEAHPQRDAYTAAWLEGYRSMVRLDSADLEIIPALVMLRRMLLIGWFSTHGHTQEARELKDYVPASLEIAEQFLGGHYLREAVQS